MKNIHSFSFAQTFFEENLYLYWGDSIGNMAKFVEKKHKLLPYSLVEIYDIKDACGMTIQNPFEKLDIYILLENKPKKDIGVLVHELTHAISLIADTVNVSTLDSHGEWNAYWIQYYINQLSNNKLL
jgi:hypothetical protein